MSSNTETVEIDTMTGPGRAIMKWRGATPGWPAQAAWLELSREIRALQADAERFRWLIDSSNWSESGDTPMVCTSEDVHWGDKARALIDRHMGAKA